MTRSTSRRSSLKLRAVSNAPQRIRLGAHGVLPGALQNLARAYGEAPIIIYNQAQRELSGRYALPKRACHRNIVGQRYGRVLDYGKSVASSFEDLVDAFPTGAIHETAVDENHRLYN